MAQRKTKETCNLYWRDVDPFVLQQIDADRASTGYPARVSVLRKVMTEWARRQASLCPTQSDEVTSPQLVRVANGG